MDKAQLQIRFLTIVASILALTDISYSTTVYTSCGGEVPTSVDIIKYPATGNYKSYENCVWNIKRETSFNLVFINSFSLEDNCRNDFVQINGGARYCGYTLPPPLYINNGKARITFKSDFSREHRGFTIQITAECHPECQNGGRCTSTDRCTCVKGWTGDRCENAICEPECLNKGKCTAPNTCTCTKDWEGDICDKAICQPECKNGGICVKPGQCACVSGWTGNDCGKAICQPECKNGGTCVKPGQCACVSGWTGNHCGKANCTDGCLNGGTCTRPEHCECAQGWKGNRCQTASTTGAVNLVCDGQEMTATFNTSYFPDNILNMNITVPYCAKGKYEVRNNNTLHCRFDKCAKRISESENVMTQENVVNVNVEFHDSQHVIERSVLYSYTLQCKFNRKVLVHTGVSVQVKRVTKEFAAEKYTNFSANMAIYRTKEFVNVSKSPHIVASADNIYVQINSSNNNDTLFQFVTTTCFATPGKDAGNPKKYIFFDDRCKLDDTFQQLNSGSRNVFRFKIRSFTFIRLKKSIFFHCELLVCKKESSSPKCSQECGMSRRRRRAVEWEDEEIMTVSSGEIQWHEANEVEMK